MKPFKGSLTPGVYTALITPIKNNKVDEPALRNFIDWQIEEGICGLVPCGTTGESATLSKEERKQVIQITLDQAKGRVPVIAGTGSNNTQDTVEFTAWAKDAGAQAALVVTPYYNKPTQKGLIQHYEAIANVGLPLVLYNVPGRTSVSLSLETIQTLSKNENIVAIKEATASMDFASQIANTTRDTLMLLSGDDFTFLPLLSVGGQGVISVLSNVTPKPFVELYQAFKNGNLKLAQQIHQKLYPLMQALFIETNPIPVKTAAALMKKCDLEFRLPLCEMEPKNLEVLKETLQTLELI